ncbi:WPP domain-interacting tail-anchored protein 1 [Canna indica]|uniref:WPP domain-interacting tail-anchored protein 1 n=1 Tax=Canna indica TaxID=4628 RepID=A0AAQ3JRC0_9LILI|nr:WPP domain-interacting tail-anchored protein 1 [Canna indica]
MATVDNDENYLQEDGLSSGVRTDVGAEALTRIELDVAYSSDKLLNLEILLMIVADRANDFEAMNMEYEDMSDESIMEAFESDILSGILDMEVKELENFMSFLQSEIMEAHQILYHGDHLEEYAAKLEEKLDDAETSVRKLQDSVADIQKQSSKFHRTLALCHDEARSDENEELENDHLSSMSSKQKPQAVDQQRHVLQMLEKSLARELDLEKKLSESSSNEVDLRQRLIYTERELYCIEESMEICLEKAFGAENAAEALLGISKELAGKVQVVQLNLSSSLHREREISSKLQESYTKMHDEESAKERLKTTCTEPDASREKGLKTSAIEADDGSARECTEMFSLREKVRRLEEQLRESDVLLQQAKASAESGHQKQSTLQSDLSHMENLIEGLKANVMRSESKAENVEAKYTELKKSNAELSEQLIFLQNSELERTKLLERRCKESDTQLEHARASVEALEEQKNGLYAAITDMQNMIEDLKSKVSKAESRSESAEAKCTLLTDTNLELNEELRFLRGKLEYLETSLHQSEGAKISSAKDIGIRTKVISDLVMKLALERECLHLQISTLIKKNKVLSERCKTKDIAHSSLINMATHNEAQHDLTKSFKEAMADSSTMSFQTESLKTTLTADESPGSDSKVEAVSPPMYINKKAIMHRNWINHPMHLYLSASSHGAFEIPFVNVHRGYLPTPYHYRSKFLQSFIMIVGRRLIPRSEGDRKRSEITKPKLRGPTLFCVAGHKICPRGTKFEKEIFQPTGVPFELQTFAYVILMFGVEAKENSSRNLSFRVRPSDLIPKACSVSITNQKDQEDPKELSQIPDSLSDGR